jgi:hypothetical protein
MNDKLLILIVGLICLIIGALIGYFIPRREKFIFPFPERKKFNPADIGTSCSPGKICPHPNLTCWPRGKSGGKCYRDPAGKGEPCIHTGNNKIKCIGRKLKCSSKNKGHPSGTMGVCE